MTKFNKTLLAAALALGAGSAYALPSFHLQGNDIGFFAYENQYRSAAACGFIGGCLAVTANDPAGWQRVDPTIAGNLILGDVFAGVLKIREIVHYDDGSQWVSATGDEFTGYFAQEVTALNLGVVADPAIVQVVLNAPAVDPFGKLAAGEMFRLYTDSTTAFNTAGTTASSIASATDGTFWGSLGVTGGYAYTMDNMTIPGSSGQFVVKNYTALNVVTEGPSYNAPDLRDVNDPSEALVGGVTASGDLLCGPTDAASGVICTDLAGQSDVRKNPAGVNSPWYYLANDPLSMYIPEPGSLALLGLGLIGLAGLRRRAA